MYCELGDQKLYNFKKSEILFFRVNSTNLVHNLFTKNQILSGHSVQVWKNMGTLGAALQNIAAAIFESKDSSWE